MAELKDQYKSMSNSYKEESSMTQELVQHHNLVVKVLTKALDTAMSLAHGNAEHPVVLIKNIEEQIEILNSQSNEQLLIINERVQKVMQMHGETSEKE